MSNDGFGNFYFGDVPFGHIDWSRLVLWEELPSEAKQADKDAGYPYRDFVYSLCPSFDWLKANIDRFKDLDDPNKIRLNLLSHLGSNFGIDVDEAQPEEYQRMRVQIAGRWNVIKGTVESYYVLCGVHGFNVEVVPLWWNGEIFVEGNPTIYMEEPYNEIDPGIFSDIKIWLNNAPVVPGTVSIDIGGTVLNDDGEGGFSGPFDSIDYGWGYIRFPTFAGSTDYVRAEYESKVGGCPNDGGGRCLTHRLRLIITPGDIAGKDELTISEAFKRLWEKLNIEVKPYHVEFEPIVYSDSGYLSIGKRYDIIDADVISTDSRLRFEAV